MKGCDFFQVAYIKFVHLSPDEDIHFNNQKLEKLAQIIRIIKARQGRGRLRNP